MDQSSLSISLIQEDAEFTGQQVARILHRGTYFSRNEQGQRFS